MANSEESYSDYYDESCDESYEDLNVKFKKVLALLASGTKFNPDPNISKYAAREVLNGMQANLDNLLRNDNSSAKQKRLTGMLGVVYLYIGIVSMDTEEMSTGEKYLEKCQNLIEPHITNPDMVLTGLNMYNQLGILWSLREPSKAKIYLEKAEELYTKFNETNDSPLDMSDLFLVNPEESQLGRHNFEKSYTLTLYYLAQVYGVMKDALKSSVYCHITLQRQLYSDDYDPIDWALNAATLSQFFGEKNGFKQARQHLAASSYILDKYKEQLDQITERNEAYDAKIEEFNHRSADVARCWAKYGLLLLSKSKERLLGHTDDDIDVNCQMASDLTAMKLEPESSTVSKEDLQNLFFKSLELTSYEKQITHQYILTIQDARLVFLNIQSWLQKAETYYTLENLASDHIEIVQDYVQMYSNFLFFEDSPETQAKLLKRGADLYENIIKKINPKYYLSYCRQIWYDLARIYSDILNIKTDKFRDNNERPTPHALTKINLLIEKSIANYNCFTDSFKEGANNEIPDKINDDYEQAFLKAYFHVAALNSRYITLDKKVQLKNVETSLDLYKYVHDYCNKHPKAKEGFQMEFGICREMIALLPMKKEKLRQELTK